MTAKVSLDHRARIQQSLEALIYRACQIGEQVQSLEKQISTYLVQLANRFDKEIHQPTKFMPLHDRDKFRQLNEHFRFKFNQTISTLFLDTRLFENWLCNYNCEVAIAHINLGVARG
ncbi:MAG: hypothetical protein V4471_02710 [Pseudomonadota bacterium]